MSNRSRVPWPRVFTSVAFAGTQLTGLVLAPGHARADCESAPAPLTWTYPNAGQTGVPTNLVVWLLPTTSVQGVSIDGEPLDDYDGPPNTLTGFAPRAPLTPDADHTLEVTLEVASEDGGVTNAVVPIPFRTGAGPLNPETGSEEAGAEERTITLDGIWATQDWDAFPAFCQDVINAGKCFDQGEDTHYILDTRGDGVAFLVTARHAAVPNGYMASVLWPASCSRPSVYLPSGLAACFRVHALDGAGHVASSEELCTTGEALPEPGQPSWRPESANPEDAGAAESSDAGGYTGSLVTRPVSDAPASTASCECAMGTRVPRSGGFALLGIAAVAALLGRRRSG